MHHLHLEKLRQATAAADELGRQRAWTRPSTPVDRPHQPQLVDRRWLSSGHLPDWEAEDRWWLSGSCKSFLETKGTSFGRKNVFLVQKKDQPQ